MSVAITIDNVVKRFGKDTIINGLSVDVRPGEFFTLLGPSGCGKTTLLRMIIGFNSIEGGTIKIDDQIINDIPVSYTHLLDHTAAFGLAAGGDVHDFTESNFYSAGFLPAGIFCVGTLLENRECLQMCIRDRSHPADRQLSAFERSVGCVVFPEMLALL